MTNQEILEILYEAQNQIDWDMGEDPGLDELVERMEADADYVLDKDDQDVVDDSRRYLGEEVY